MQNDEIKEILSNDNIHIIECEKNWCNAYGYEKSQLKEDLLDYIINLQNELKYQKEMEDEYIEKHTKLLQDFTNLQEENEDLKDRLKVMKHFKNSLQEENERLSIELNQNMIERNNYLSRCEKAIEFIKEKISSTQGVINDYMYHKEHNKILIELLQEDIEMYKKELHILNGGDE